MSKYFMNLKAESERNSFEKPKSLKNEWYCFFGYSSGRAPKEPGDGVCG